MAALLFLSPSAVWGQAQEPRAAEQFETALQHYRAGRYAAAIDHLERALALDPNSKDLIFNLALVHEKSGDVDSALRRYQQYAELESDPDESERIAATIARLKGVQKTSKKPAEPAAKPAPAAPEPVASPRSNMRSLGRRWE